MPLLSIMREGTVSPPNPHHQSHRLRLRLQFEPSSHKSRGPGLFWLVIGGIVLLVIIIGTLGKSPSYNSEKTESSATTGSGPTAQETQFNALTPSQHLSQAKTALNQNATPDQIEEGLRHLCVIPRTSPEAVQAKSLTTKLVRAQHLAEARLLIDRLQWTI